jgi:hypothetical protein
MVAREIEPDRFFTLSDKVDALLLKRPGRYDH